MKSVWLLSHVHVFDAGHEDLKLIGVFATAEEAEAARIQVAEQVGFRDCPDNFSIEEHSLGRIGWLEGYVTLE